MYLTQKKAVTLTDLQFACEFIQRLAGLDALAAALPIAPVPTDQSTNQALNAAVNMGFLRSLPDDGLMDVSFAPGTTLNLATPWSDNARTLQQARRCIDGPKLSHGGIPTRRRSQSDLG
jgi:hypothetical protein